MVTLKVNGMNCENCKAAVEGALKGVPGVKDVQVSLEDGVVKVDGDTPVEPLLQAVEHAGYAARQAESD